MNLQKIERSELSDHQLQALISVVPEMMGERCLVPVFFYQLSEEFVPSQLSELIDQSDETDGRIIIFVDGFDVNESRRLNLENLVVFNLEDIPNRPFYKKRLLKFRNGYVDYLVIVGFAVTKFDRANMPKVQFGTGPQQEKVKKMEFYKTCKEASDVCVANKFLNAADYYERYKATDLRLPGRPDVYYKSKSWPGWDKFLGNE